MHVIIGPLYLPYSKIWKDSAKEIYKIYRLYKDTFIPQNKVENENNSRVINILSCQYLIFIIYENIENFTKKIKSLPLKRSHLPYKICVHFENSDPSHKCLVMERLYSRGAKI